MAASKVDMEREERQSRAQVDKYRVPCTRLARSWPGIKMCALCQVRASEGRQAHGGFKG